MVVTTAKFEDHKGRTETSDSEALSGSFFIPEIDRVCQRGKGTMPICRFLISQLLWVLMLLAPEQVSAQDLQSQVSEARLGSLKFRAILNLEPSGMPALPDLSYPRKVPIPGTASIEQDLPVLWNGVLIPPGYHRVEIESFRDREPQLVVLPFGGGKGIRIPAVRGILDRPSGALRWSVSSTVPEGSKNPADGILQLDLRWGILQLTCEGVPLSTVSQKEGRWTLETHPFPPSSTLGEQQFLGIFEDPRMAPRRWRCLLEKRGNGKVQLVLMDPARDRRVASHLKWLNRLRDLQRQLRFLEGDSTEESQKMRDSLSKEVSRAQTMVSALDVALQNLDDASRQRSLNPYGQVGPGRSGLEVNLKIDEPGAFLHVLCKEGHYRFLVSDTL